MTMMNSKQSEPMLDTVKSEIIDVSDDDVKETYKICCGNKNSSFKNKEANLQSKELAKRWLNGLEYLNLIKMFENSGDKCNFQFLKNGEHPDCIYFKPVDGMLYGMLVQGTKKVGFPRFLSSKRKIYVWKRMNFETHLPKQNPLVSYVVASAMIKREKTLFKMHIVCNSEEKLDSNENYIALCHIRKLPYIKEPNKNLAIKLTAGKEEHDAYLERLGAEIISKNMEKKSNNDSSFAKLESKAILIQESCAVNDDDKPKRKESSHDISKSYAEAKLDAKTIDSIDAENHPVDVQVSFGSFERRFGEKYLPINERERPSNCQLVLKKPYKGSQICSRPIESNNKHSNMFIYPELFSSNVFRQSFSIQTATAPSKSCCQKSIYPLLPCKEMKETGKPESDHSPYSLGVLESRCFVLSNENKLLRQANCILQEQNKNLNICVEEVKSVLGGLDRYQNYEAKDK